jgi:peroxiredoxin Q/BCP
MLSTGDVVEDFELSDQNGTTRRLSDLLAAGPVVLFFYPKAMTTGCTKEACHFRDLASEFAAVGAQPVGISADRATRQAEFDSRHDLGFPLLSDPTRRVAASFGVTRPGPLFNRRATFVIGEDRRVLAVLRSELNMDVHADKALAVLRDRVA